MEWEEPHLSGFMLDKKKNKNHSEKLMKASSLFALFKSRATVCIWQATKEKDLTIKAELEEKSHLYNYYSWRANRLVQMLNMRKEKFYKN